MWWWLVVLALPQEEGGHVCPVTLTNRLFGQQPRSCSSPKKKSVHAKFTPSSTDATPLKKHVCRDISGPGKGCCLPLPVWAQKILVSSTATVSGCQGPGKHDKAGRRNFPLTQEIGTSCAATQSNHLSYFTDQPDTCLWLKGTLLLDPPLPNPRTSFHQFLPLQQKETPVTV